MQPDWKGYAKDSMLVIVTSEDQKYQKMKESPREELKIMCTLSRPLDPRGGIFI